MKRFLFALIAMVIAGAAVANAQPKAIGGRLGPSGLEFSYQHSVAAGQNGYANFIQLDAGMIFPYSPNESLGGIVTGTYNFVFARPDWTPKGTWEWYAGPGLSTGYSNGFVLGVVGHVGLMYTFDFGLQLGASFRPAFGFRANDTVSFWESGAIAGLWPTISVRYAFR